MLKSRLIVGVLYFAVGLAALGSAFKERIMNKRRTRLGFLLLVLAAAACVLSTVQLNDDFLRQTLEVAISILAVALSLGGLYLLVRATLIDLGSG